MALETEVIGGVDTHTATHHAVVIDTIGARLADREFPATASGYEALRRWMSSYGRVIRVGVEGTGAYGAGLARHLHQAGITVIEVPRPDRRLRRSVGKSDLIDAEAAARAVLAGTAVVVPKLAHGPVEAIRVLRVARDGALKAKTAATNALKAVVVTAPEPLRGQLRGLSRVQLVASCRRLRPEAERLADPVQATKAALRSMAERAHDLEVEARALGDQLSRLTSVVAPATSRIFGLGPDTAGALLAAVGDNPDRLRSEAAFARLAGVAPIPASSGKTNRHRLHRGGDRSANKALHIAVVVRLRYCARTRAYAKRRTAAGMSMPEIIRCLKRYLAREVFHALRTDFVALTT
jgi:transposase